ncbi:MAG: fibrobacter succinogenes major paralogous domain-containing protein [Chitinophagaceae bacterium]
MKKVSLKLSSVVITIMLLISFGSSTAQSVIIGEQVWMTQNLNVDKFRNGDPIPNAKTDEEWLNAGNNKQAAWCYYENKRSNGSIYGKLYNWYAVNDPRGLAPDGWHVADNSDWAMLTNYLGGDSIASGKMKSTGNQYWGEGIFENKEASNVSGFSGLPCGFRFDHGLFAAKEVYGYWWSSNEYNNLEAVAHQLSRFDGKKIMKKNKKKAGFSVRCLKD